MSKVTTTFEAVDTGMVATIQKIERETKSMKDTTEKTEKQINTSFSAMAAAGAGLAIGIGAIKGAFAALTGTIDNFGQALDMGGRLSDLSARTGETAGNLLLLERAFDNSGVGADKVGSSINKLQKFMSEANTGTEANMIALAELGLSYEKLVAQTPTEQLRYVAEGIKSIESPTERAAMAMKIFGKSGGELLPFLQNFSDELGNAQDELGSMTGIMDKKSEVFDTVSDKIQAIKGKFTEFAAGLLSNVTPALELFTTMLSKVDAAGIGQRLTTGAMKFFDVLIGAFKNGAEAAKLVESALMFGVKSFGNSLLNNIIDSAAYIGKLFIGGFQSAVNSLKAGLYEASSKFTLMNLDGLVAAAGIFGDKAEQAAKDLAAPIRRSMELASSSYGEKMAKENAKISDDLASVMDNANKSTKDFFGAGDELKKLEGSLKKIGDEGERFRKGIIGDEKEPNPFKPMEESVAKISVSMRKTGEDVKGMVKSVQELSLVQKLMNDLTNAKISKRTGIEPLKGDLKRQMEAGNFRQAERTIEKIARKEQEAAIRLDEKGNRDTRNIADIAKAEGIDTFGKSQEQLRKEILEKRQGKTLAEIKKEEERKKEADKQPEKKADPLLEMVKMIKDIVAKIEPKLPQRALI